MRAAANTSSSAILVGDPEEKREWMHDLPGELPPPAATALPRQLVGAVSDEASRGLAAREPFATRSEVSEEESDRLASVPNARFRAPEARIRLHSSMVEPQNPKRIREPADPRRDKYGGPSVPGTD